MKFLLHDLNLKAGVYDLSDLQMVMAPAPEGGEGASDKPRA